MFGVFLEVGVEGKGKDSGAEDEESHSETVESDEDSSHDDGRVGGGEIFLAVEQN